MSRTLNFDNFMTEKKQDPVLVTVFGKEYAVKPEIPAIVMVTLARANDSKVSNSEAAVMIFRAGDVLFGQETINEFCAKGMTSEQLLSLIKKVFDTINGKDVDGDDAEEISDEDGMTSAGGDAKK
jgi:hypothetical protein